MSLPTLEQLDQIRQKGFRPNIVGCFTYDKKILFVYNAEYKLWQFPQGGINNRETIDQAFAREMHEELGPNVLNNCEENLYHIGFNKIEFPKEKQNQKELITDTGKKMFMKGKHYFFLVIKKTNPELNIKNTEFDKYKWETYDEAITTANSIYQPGKKRITIHSLDLLKKFNFIN